MSTVIKKFPIADGDMSLPERWCIQVVTDEAMTPVTFLEAEVGKRHWIEKVSVTFFEKKSFSILDGDNDLIGPITTGEGIPWVYTFHRECHNTVNNPLKLKTESNTKTHMIIEGHTDVYLSKASNPNPEDGAIDITKTVTLSWESSPTVSSHIVYFGTTDQPGLIGTQTDNSIVMVCEAGTTFYWRIDESDGDNTVTGDTWTFTTEEEP